MNYGDEWEQNSKAHLQAMWGADMYPKRQEDGTWSAGIGHTGAPFPRGTGHDYCWKPWNCISCGCSQSGPCDSHRNIAFIAGYRP